MKLRFQAFTLANGWRAPTRRRKSYAFEPSFRRVLETPARPSPESGSRSRTGSSWSLRSTH